MSLWFLLVMEPGGELKITPSRYNEWRELADHQGVIYWNRQGLVRVVSNAVLDNALCIYSEYTRMVDAGRILTLPDSARGILWEQSSERPNPITGPPKRLSPMKPGFDPGPKRA